MLLRTIWDNDLEKLGSLLDSGSDIEARDRDGRTPLINSVIEKKLSFVEHLVVRGANVNAKDHNGFTALHFAAQDGLYGIAKYLLEKGADISLTDAYGNTALFRALSPSENMGKMIKLFLSFGADPKKKNLYGVSPLDLAAKVSNYDLMQYFKS